MRQLLVLIAVFFISSTVNAQVSISIGFNVERQPIWGPTGYDYVEYYYLPDIDAYYYVPQRTFFYYERNRWISGPSLPARYRGYDLYSSYKIVLNEPRPYLHAKKYREKYSSYKGRHEQQVIRDSRDKRYFINKSHPEHNNWKKQNNYDSNNKKGQEKKSRRK